MIAQQSYCLTSETQTIIVANHYATRSALIDYLVLSGLNVPQICSLLAGKSVTAEGTTYCVVAEKTTYSEDAAKLTGIEKHWAEADAQGSEKPPEAVYWPERFGAYLRELTHPEQGDIAHAHAMGVRLA